MELYKKGKIGSFEKFCFISGTFSTVFSLILMAHYDSNILIQNSFLCYLFTCLCLYGTISINLALIRHQLIASFESIHDNKPKVLEHKSFEPKKMIVISTNLPPVEVYQDKAGNGYAFLSVPESIYESGEDQ